MKNQLKSEKDRGKAGHCDVCEQGIILEHGVCCVCSERATDIGIAVLERRAKRKELVYKIQKATGNGMSAGALSLAGKFNEFLKKPSVLKKLKVERCIVCGKRVGEGTKESCIPYSIAGNHYIVCMNPKCQIMAQERFTFEWMDKYIEEEMTPLLKQVGFGKSGHSGLKCECGHYIIYKEDEGVFFCQSCGKAYDTLKLEGDKK